MTTEDLKLLQEVQQKDDEEMALQKKSERYRNSDKKLFETVVARVEHVISELLHEPVAKTGRHLALKMLGEIR